MTAGVVDYAETAVARIHQGSEQAAPLDAAGLPSCRCRSASQSGVNTCVGIRRVESESVVYSAWLCGRAETNGHSALTAAEPTAASTVFNKPCLAMQGLIAEGEESQSRRQPPLRYSKN